MAGGFEQLVLDVVLVEKEQTTEQVPTNWLVGAVVYQPQPYSRADCCRQVASAEMPFEAVEVGEAAHVQNLEVARAGPCWDFSSLVQTKREQRWSQLTEQKEPR